jgi:hypothetical protein
LHGQPVHAAEGGHAVIAHVELAAHICACGGGAEGMLRWEVEESDLYQLLAWLVAQGARLKGHLADAVTTLREALLTLGAVPGLMLPLPDSALVSRLA